VQSRPHGADRHIHDGGHFFVAELLHLPKDESGSQFGWQLRKKFLDYDSIFDVWPFCRLSRVELCDFRSLEPKSIHTKPNADSIKETGERAVIAKFMQFSECLEKGLLANIFRLVPIAQQVRCCSEETIPVSRDEKTQCAVIPTAAPSNPLALLCGCFHSRKGDDTSTSHTEYSKERTVLLYKTLSPFHNVPRGF
jgi:hypothetical protein